MTDGDDHLAEAVEELYSADPEEFTERRTALVARARAAGDAGAARQIGGLRKPTRSAWVINQLARAEPALAGQLTELGDELRAAQESLDGARMRELSAQRRRLIDELAQQAFSAAGQPTPPAALRDEVTVTLGAALADPALAGQLQAGTLVRAVQPGGFGPGPPSLTVLPGGAGAPGASGTAARSGSRAGAGSRAGTGSRPGTAAKADPAARAAAAAAQAEAREREAQERRRLMVAEAEQRMAEAGQAADAATSAEAARLDEVERLEEQLSAARRGLELARSQARRARTAQRAARQALGRLRK